MRTRCRALGGGVHRQSPYVARRALHRVPGRAHPGARGPSAPSNSNNKGHSAESDRRADERGVSGVAPRRLLVRGARRGQPAGDVARGSSGRFSTRLGSRESSPSAQRSLADGPSSLTLGRVQTLATRLARVTELAERYPAIAERPGDFRASEALRCTPTLRYPALLRAALTTARNRKAQPGDELDVGCISVRGLSRSDIATADRSMAHIVRERKLIAQRCQLVSGREGPTASSARSMRGRPSHQRTSGHRGSA